MILRGSEMKAVGAYLTGHYHELDVKRRFQEAVKQLGMERILSILDGVASCSEEEKLYLRKKILAMKI